MPKKFRLRDAGDRGWFVGDFDKSVFKTGACEVAFQTNYRGEASEPHYHKIATEINLITRGLVKINGETYTAGQGIVLHPGEVATCEYLADTDTLVVKVPGVLDDKYLV
jgi:hypothetical protein